MGCPTENTKRSPESEHRTSYKAVASSAVGCLNQESPYLRYDKNWQKEKRGEQGEQGKSELIEFISSVGRGRVGGLAKLLTFFPNCYPKLLTIPKKVFWVAVFYPPVLQTATQNCSNFKNTDLKILGVFCFVILGAVFGSQFQKLHQFLALF